MPKSMKVLSRETPQNRQAQPGRRVTGRFGLEDFFLLSIDRVMRFITIASLTLAFQDH
jgi:hypothetical protein